MPPLRILTAADVTSILSTLPIPLALRSQSTVFTAFSRQSRASASGPAGGVPAIQTPVRLVVSSEEMKMLFMPARAPTDVASATSEGATGKEGEGETETTIAFKLVSVPTKGSAEGLPATTLVMDEVDGRVKAVINARKLTTLRNACGSALFLSLYPPTTTTHLLIFGSGAQAQTHTTLFLRLYPSLTRVTFIVRSATSRSSSLVQDLQSQYPGVSFTTAVHPSPSPELTKLVGEADIILTATSSFTPLFTSSATVPRPGARVIMIGSYKPEMHEVDGELLKRASRVVVDSHEAVEAEAGEFIDVGMGNVGGGNGCVELGDVLDGVVGVEGGRRKGWWCSSRYAILKVGVGIQDVAIAKLVLDEAERHNVGTIVPDYD